MFKIGRDKAIFNFDKDCDRENNIVCICYGEVDCRCHVGRQILLGRNIFDICRELAGSYFETIKNNIKFAKVMVVAIVPPMERKKYEDVHGEITHNFPFIGNDEDRVNYTNTLNKMLRNFCEENNYIFFDPYEFYKTPCGTLLYELSDGQVHVKDNNFFLKEFYKLTDF